MLRLLVIIGTWMVLVSCGTESVIPSYPLVSPMDLNLTNSVSNGNVVLEFRYVNAEHYFDGFRVYVTSTNLPGIGLTNRMPNNGSSNPDDTNTATIPGITWVNTETVKDFTITPSMTVLFLTDKTAHHLTSGIEYTFTVVSYSSVLQLESQPCLPQSIVY